MLIVIQNVTLTIVYDIFSLYQMENNFLKFIYFTLPRWGHCSLGEVYSSCPQHSTTVQERITLNSEMLRLFRGSFLVFGAFVEEVYRVTFFTLDT
jgi:hypothetical protein